MLLQNSAFTPLLRLRFVLDLSYNLFLYTVVQQLTRFLLTARRAVRLR